MPDDPSDHPHPPHPLPWRERAWHIVFEHNTKGARAFDIALLFAIALSVVAVMLESVSSIRARWGTLLLVVEWCFTALFTAEYILRLLITRRPSRYAFSFFGIVDLLACLPTYLGLLFPGAQSLLVIRILRLLRMFRILKMMRHLREGTVILRALRNSMPKIIVFIFSILTLITIFGTLMYLVEGHRPNTGFTSIPVAIYWAIVTLTTVGYGDITPTSPLGQLLSAMVMLSGYAIIAVPTGIITVDLFREFERSRAQGHLACPSCRHPEHLPAARFCHRCGASLYDAPHPPGQGPS